MNILYFHQHFSTPKGSTANRSYAMSKALIQAGHEVTVVCGKYHGGVSGLQGPFIRGIRKGVVDGIDVIELELKYSNYQGFLKRSLVFLKFALKSVDIALRERCDLIFATSTPLTAGIPGIISKCFQRKTFVFEVRDLWPELPKAMGVIKNPVVLSLMSFLEHLSYRCADSCIGLSPGIVEGIKKKAGETTPVALIPNGCDFEIFNAKHIKPVRPTGIKNSDLMAIFTGAHGIANGLDAVLDAAEVLKSRGRTDIKFVFIGDGKKKPALVKRASEKGLNNCLFLDPVPKNELAGIMKGADIGLMILANVPAFYYGTSPNKFFDYLSIGLPVLNNYPGWIAEMIKKYSCGYAIGPDNPSIFADALEHAACNRTSLKIMGENAKKLGRSKFDRKKLAKKFVNWLERTAEKSL